jgi:signal transduction histidine kinase
MLGSAISKLSLRKKLTILALGGVLLPLLLLTYMQYQSLADLQNKTKGAFKDNVRQGLTIVEHLMKQHLETFAAQTLSPIGNINSSSAAAAEEFERYFADVKHSHPEVQEIFAFVSSISSVSSLDKAHTNTFAYKYSDKFEKIAQAEFTPAQSDTQSLFDKAWITQSFVDSNRQYLFVHHSCPSCSASTRQGNYVFYPLKDSTTGEQRGFAGVLLSEGFVRDGLIARSIFEATQGSHTTGPLAFAVNITDENRQVIYSNAAAQHGYILETNFDPPFSNWKASVGLKNTNLDDLARSSFLHSAGSTLLVLVFLLCGIALTLRATDREARLAQAKSNFVSNVSHELKTPLASLSLFSEILELGRVNNEEKKTEYYRIIRHESLRLNKMIDNILDFSKIEAGRKTYEFAEGDIAEVIDDVLSSYRYQIINSGFEIQTNIEPSLPPVLIDRDAMAQAVSNLIDNAIKYSGETKQLSITTKTQGADLSIAIADHGMGIPRAEQQKIFEKFYRVGNGLVHDVKGSGLGLSLVKHIVAAHKGTVSVESDVGKGSRFTILLPLARKADAEASEQRAAHKRRI